MPEQHAPMRQDPGHLDIDAVSAYVDRDLAPEELDLLAYHLSHCDACHREVLEIHTTVLLLSSLPQYAPRRSFRLGQEHARASRRRHLERDQLATPVVTTGQPGAPVSVPPTTRDGGWLSGLHVAALVVGTLLLLVTAGDLTGFVADPSPVQLAAPTAAAGLVTQPEAPAPAPATDQALMAREIAPPAASDADAGPSESFSAFQQAPAAPDGTESANSASEEMLEAESEAPRAAATVAGVAAVTQAIPTPAAASSSTGIEADEQTAPPADTADTGQPSLLRLVQIALGLLLAWLIVSIAGMRWMRRLR